MNMTNELKEQAKHYAMGMERLAADVAHELRTPLVAIKSGIGGIREFLPQLIEAYKAAKDEKLHIPEIQPRHLNLLDKILNSIEQELFFVSSHVNMLAMNLSLINSYADELQCCSIRSSLQQAFVVYPYRSDRQRKLAVKDFGFDDFSFKGNSFLIEYVFLNLIKGAIYRIEHGGKGKIEIVSTEEGFTNKLCFKDTGTGIASSILPYVFDESFSTHKDSVGLGLFYCQKIMQVLKGDINCHSEEGVYTEFVLSFPKIG
jgi:two-component system CAI-1 autoinducer sensor kinase/phosphatase CqsS